MSRLLLALFLLVSPFAAVAGEPDLLEPQQAFRFDARVVSADALEVRYQIAPGYYLYRDKFRFSAQPNTVELEAPQLPPGKVKKDEFFGEVQTYRGQLLIRVPFRNPDGATALTLTAVSQGCADAGVCYVPQEQQAQLQLASFTGGAPAAPAPDVTALEARLFGSGGAEQSDTGVALLFKGSVGWLVLTFFGFGLLLSCTPCVLPMVPILSGIIVGGRGHPTRMHTFLLSGAYVLGMALTYATAGVAAGLSGALLSAALQNAWVLSGFAVIFVLLAGAMFGVYRFQLPLSLQTRLAAAANRLPGGRFAGVFSMGALSALIASPCIAAPLAGALLYISQSRDVVLGGAALFSMALGMGVPLLAVGVSAGALLPKAGPWMQTVQRFFGVVLLGVAIYFISPVIPIYAQMAAWAVLLVFTGIYLRAVDALPPDARGFQRFGKGVGMIALVLGVAYLIGALAGSRDLLRPLAGLRGASAAAESPAVFSRINSLQDLEATIKGANGRPVVLDFYADWCVTCKEMERDTFPDARVKARLAEMVAVQADVTANTEEHARLLRRFRLFGPPGLIFFDRQGQEITGVRVIGYQPPRQFANVLDKVLAVR
jgi:thioredoxin:protein disulfide reductase